jgi:hypothetical protein
VDGDVVVNRGVVMHHGVMHDVVMVAAATSQGGG